MDYRTMLGKTGLVLVGVCKGVVEYTSKKTQVTYYSADFELQGCRQNVNVRLPEVFDRSALKEYELVTIRCIVKPTFDRKNIEIEAVSSGS